MGKLFLQQQSGRGVQGNSEAELRDNMAIQSQPSTLVGRPFF